MFPQCKFCTCLLCVSSRALLEFNCSLVEFVNNYVLFVSVSTADPPVKTVRKFLHLLEHSDADFEEELGTFSVCNDKRVPF